MKKNISAALITLACFSAISAAAFADGPVGRAMDGIGRAGRDIADGAGDAVDDVIDGVTGDDDTGDDITGDDNTGDDTTGDDITGDDTTGDDTTGDDTTGDPADTPAGDDDGDSASDPVSSEESPAASIEDSGAVGGINANNPGTGVTYGLTAAAAVLAAVGVAVASARKDK